MFEEKLILDQIGSLIKNSNYKMTKHEQSCIDKYQQSPYLLVPLNLGVWGAVAYYTADLTGT